MIQSSALGSADRAPLNDLKRSLLAILSLYKSEFAGSIFVEELLKPMIEILFRDLADVAETVNKFLIQTCLFENWSFLVKFITKDSIFRRAYFN